MEKALTKVGSLKVGGLWISKKAKEEFSNITEDLNVSKTFFSFLLSLFCFVCFVLSTVFRGFGLWTV